MSILDPAYAIAALKLLSARLWDRVVFRAAQDVGLALDSATALPSGCVGFGSIPAGVIGLDS